VPALNCRGRAARDRREARRAPRGERMHGGGSCCSSSASIIPCSFKLLSVSIVGFVNMMFSVGFKGSQW